MIFGVAMKTIFDYNPTDKELKELFGFDRKTDSMAYGFSIFPLPNKDYEKENDDEGRLLDLAKLFEYRGQTNEAAEIWAKIPDVARQYRGSFDYKVTPQ